MYESVDLVIRRLEEKHGSAPTRDKAGEVAAHVAQGRQYFLAASSAPPLIKPLLLYYGVYALTRALILSADIARREATPPHSHGVRCIEWGTLWTAPI